MHSPRARKTPSNRTARGYARGGDDHSVAGSGVTSKEHLECNLRYGIRIKAHPLFDN
jgi:hypothetical protein